MDTAKVRSLAREILALPESERQQLAREVLPALLATRAGLEEIDEAFRDLSDDELRALIERARAGAPATCQRTTSPLSSPRGFRPLVLKAVLDTQIILRGASGKDEKMTGQETVKATLSPQQLERLWAEHLKGEFESKDVEATLATMVEDAYVNHMPVNTGGRGKDALRVFYRDDFIPSWPGDLQIAPLNRVVGEGQLVDELHITFTHSKPMQWLLPEVPPTQKRIAIDVVVVVQFRGDKVACERIYWDHASVLRQVGLLKE